MRTLIFAAAALLALAFAGQATAGTVTGGSPQYRYVAAPGEVNAVQVQVDETSDGAPVYTIVDSAGVIAGAMGCVQQGPNQATCSGADTSLFVDLGDGNDSYVRQGSNPPDVSERAVQVEGGPGDDQLIGGPDADFLSGGPGNDRISGGPGKDVLDGEDGDDTVDGGPGDDSVMGHAGNDILIGGLGLDTNVGGLPRDETGKDTFVIRDGYQEGIVCAPGERVEADPSDFFSEHHCDWHDADAHPERVPKAATKAKTGTLTGARMPVRMSCSAPAGSTCKGLVMLLNRTGPKPYRPPHEHAQAEFTIPGGKTSTVLVKLTGFTIHPLLHFKHLAGIALVMASDGQGNTHTTRRAFTLLAPKKRR